MNPRFTILSATLVLFGHAPLRAQTTLVDWSQLWDYMHPTTGTLPVGSGITTPHPAGTTPWFASQASFDADYTGPSFAAGGAGFEAGSGAGPLGYGGVDYITTPQPAPAEFTALGTTLTPPATALRYTGYFRTTFTVPDDGNLYVNPVIRYILDDGGFIYLDGVLVLRVNMATGINDDYVALAANTTATESVIRVGELNLAANSTTGANTAGGPATAGNATVVTRVTSLAPGVHTLAVAAHNQANGSSDLLMAVQLQAAVTDCVLAASASNVTRDMNGTPNDPDDDTIDWSMTVVPTGTVSASWEVIAPGSSAAFAQGGAYNTPVPVTVVPVTEFAPGPLVLIVADSDAPSCNTSLSIFPPRIIATDDRAGTNLPIMTTGTLPTTGWVFDDAARTMFMNNGGGAARKVVTSVVVDLSSSPAVQFTGVLQIDDTSSGTEAADSFVAYLVLDGDVGNPVNLITPYDTQVVNGVLDDDELAPAGGTFVRNLSHLIPASVNSAQIIIEGINDSPNESFTVRDLLFSIPSASLQATAGPIVYDEQNDTFTAPVTIAGVSLGASTGWNSDATPSAGLYADPQPVVFGPFSAADSPLTITLTDALDTNVTTEFTLALPPRFVIGQKDFGGGLIDVSTSYSAAPPAEWIIDEGLRTLEMNNGGTPAKVLVSEGVDLSAVGEVMFSAQFRAADSSTGSNFETADKFKAELVYHVGGVPTTINLIDPWDLGNGDPATLGSTGGVNGPKDGFLNGYQGTAGTDLETFAVYAAGLDDYDAHPDRDEFNLRMEPGATSIDNTFALSATIPAEADDVRLYLTGEGVGGATPTERFFVSGILFFTATISDDSDGDGMTDEYEDANGLDKNDPADRDLDQDGDGQTNYQEFLAGTAANDSTSLLQIVSVTKAGAIATLTWKSIPGKVYRIDIGDDLQGWTDLEIDFPAADAPATTTDSGPLDLTAIGNPPSQFARIRLKN